MIHGGRHVHLAHQSSTGMWIRGSSGKLGYSTTKGTWPWCPAHAGGRKVQHSLLRPGGLKKPYKHHER